MEPETHVLIYGHTCNWENSTERKVVTGNEIPRTVVLEREFFTGNEIPHMVAYSYTIEEHRRTHRHAQFGFVCFANELWPL
jgi:hypothetical protein